MRLPLLALALTAWMLGCASHTTLAPEERARLEREYQGPKAQQFLKLSYYVLPFFGDASRRLLSPVAPEDVRLLNDTQGQPISPGPVQGIVPAGTKARIVQVEFPTAWVVTERVLYSPRTQPWVMLEVEGAPAGPPLVLVLRPQIKNAQDFQTELERYLVPRDMTDRLAAFSEEVQIAVREKRVIPEMPSAAVEMAWGYPERIQVKYQEQERLEEWSYPSNRQVFLQDGRVTRVIQPVPKGTQGSTGSP